MVAYDEYWYNLALVEQKNYILSFFVVVGANFMIGYIPEVNYYFNLIKSGKNIQ